ncbi:MAG TPA: tRNA (adenosine(37)-N6)-threonylcarbamoyltransferase complex dimerization subunit type 1 TsaB [Candidatus Krumholzibacteria bacterium]|nr:tRNA (adenosine(37)-N6)-threonylcarbamoyltransferase complex dimerization subunit type 1 TsaB [Candidatus Krumholzibacteria bacterium]
MVTLAIDTSHPTGAVTLARDGVVLGTETFSQPSSHLVALAQAVGDLLARGGLAARDIRRVAVVVGPGSFTGLRIGLAFAKGLHAAGGSGIVPIDTLRLLALPQFDRHARVCAMIDARRGEVYAAVLARAGDAERAADPAAALEVLAPCARTPAALLDAIADEPAVFVGTGALAARDEIAARFPRATIAPAAECAPSTAFLATIAPRMRPLNEAAVRALEPRYIRPSGAERVKLRSHQTRPADGESGSHDG